MRRTNEFAVGLAVLLALALVVAGALWLSETDVNQKQVNAQARFRTVGGLGVGAPVTLRGVRVGRVEAIRLVADEWVETELSIDKNVELPAKPAVISASASLFGEWSATIVPYDEPPSDPNLRAALAESDRAGPTSDSSPPRPAASPATWGWSPSASARRSTARHSRTCRRACRTWRPSRAGW